LIPDRSHAPTTAKRCATLPGLARQRHGGHWLSVEMSALDRLVTMVGPSAPRQSGQVTCRSSR
jgi:hypothetical protein